MTIVFSANTNGIDIIPWYQAQLTSDSHKQRRNNVSRTIYLDLIILLKLDEKGLEKNPFIFPG